MKDYKNLQNGSDIRGIAVGENANLTKTAARDLAWAFVAWLSSRYAKTELKIAVGRDSRTTGRSLLNEICDALKEAGVEVFDCGLASTPAMFMATKLGPLVDGSIEITASHLPSDRNGLKFFSREGGLEKSDISFLITMAENMQDEFEFNDKEVKILGYPLMKDYSKHLRNLICRDLDATEKEKPLKDLHIVVDAGNGAGGFFVNEVLNPLGADTDGSQFLEPDGAFPNHIPNPENADAMKSICEAVRNYRADLGIIFDTDVDRAAAVGSDAKEIARNRIVALASILASEKNPGSWIVTDSITSTQLKDFLENKLGLHHLRYQRGYRNVINKGIELNSQGENCVLAIETSGHAAMKENYFLDDGAYLATKIIAKAAKLKKENKDIQSLLSELKDPLEAKEVRYKVLAKDFSGYAQGILDDLYEAVDSGSIQGWSLEKPNYEGVRINTPQGWMLIRKSLHDPVMPLNLESDIPGGACAMLSKLKEILKKYSELQ